MKYISKNIKNQWQQYFKYYTMLFLLAAMLVFSWYFFTGTSFIWEHDGWMQHYKALVYYSRYLRQIFYSIFCEHQLNIPAWDFNIGEGNDIIATLHYYVIGDPFTVFSVFVPEAFMYVYYAAILILRMYLAGIAFSVLCFKTGRTSNYAVMAGCLTYVFCYWITINVIKHPYFLNPMIYLPMLITGIEKMLKKERPYLFIITVFLSAISNFYFFYILVLLTVIYVITRLYNLYKTGWRKWISVLWRITSASVAGVLMAAVILLPVCYVFLNDTRMSTGSTCKLVYNLSYYAQLPVFFISGDCMHWMCMGYAAPVLPAILILFSRCRKYFLLKAFFIMGSIIMLVPFLGKVLNGFSYASNRWSFAFALVCAYILTLMWPHLMHLKLKETKILLACTAFYFIICFAVCLISGRAKKMTCVSIFLVCVFLIIVSPVAVQFKNKLKISGRKNKQRFAIIFIVISVFCNNYLSNISNGYAAECKKISEIKELSHNETQNILNAAQTVNTNPLFRYSGKELTENANIIAGISSTQYFWSLSNPHMADFRRKIEMRETSAYNYNGYDDRTALMALSSVLYYTYPYGKKYSPPYGYKLVKNASDKNYKVYKNKYALPYGYTYKNFIPEEKWEKLSSIDKQDALLQGIVLENYNGKIQETSVKSLSQKIDYKITCKNNDVTINDNSFVAASDGAEIKIKFKGLKNSETYFSIKGLDLEDTSNDAKLTIKSSKDIAKKLFYRTKESRNYNGRHDYIVNLGYSKKALKKITITFPFAGTYLFDDINIICEPMKDYGNKISTLKEDVLENIQTGTNCFSGSIALNQPKLLCLPIPYSDGWEAFVDGKKADLYKANLMYMALELDAGRHNILLKYHTPLLKAGTCISVISVLLFGIWIWISENKRKKQPGKRDENNG